MSPQRIQRKRTAGWRMPEGAVYVGRPSRWGNPFRIHGGHHLVGPPWALARATWSHLPEPQCDSIYVSSSQPIGTADPVEAFRTLIEVRLRDEPERLRDWLYPLVGRDLACWCPLEDSEGDRVPCHADVLLELANGEAS